jgi:hypothetical protein
MGKLRLRLRADANRLKILSSNITIVIMEKKVSCYVTPRIEVLAVELEGCCLASSANWNGSVGVEGDYDQTEGEW